MKTNTVLMATLLSLAACSNHQDTATSQKSAQPLKSYQVAHQSNVKGSAPVSIQYEMLDTPAVNNSVRIRITLQTALAADQMKLSYSVSNNINSVEPSTETTFRRPEPGQSLQHTITVLPRSEGEHHINVSVSLTQGTDAPQTTSLMIPLRIGTVTSSKQIPQGLIKQGDTPAQTVIELPAEQQIQR